MTAGDEEYRAWAQRRVLRVLVLAQIFGGAGLAAGVSVGALLAKDLLGSTSSSGTPAALFAAGSAAAAVGVGRISDRFGRRIGLASGFAVGAAGGAGVATAAVTRSVPLLLVSLVVYGAGTATNLQCRYAGADLALESERGRAVSRVLVATTIGAVAGPTLLQFTGDVAESAGLPRLSGPFVLAAIAYTIAGSVLAALLRPDPLLTARRMEMANRPDPTVAPVVDVPPLQPGRQRGPLLLAASGMIIAQAVMVAVMTMTPVHLEDHHHGLGVVGTIIGLHIGAMYLPSPITGRLVDVHSPAPVTTAGGVVLIAAAIIAASAGGSPAVLALALMLLGLGWNLSLVGGTAMVTDLANLDDRARTQGTVDLGVALAGATGGLASGAVLAATSFRVLGLGAAAVALLVVITATAARTRRVATV